MTKGERFIVCSLAALILSACQGVPEEPKTVQVRSDAPEGRACAMCFASDSTVFIAGGRTQEGTYSSSMLCYDAANDQWSTRPCPILPRVNGTACATSQGVFLGLGYAGGNIHMDSVYLHDWWRYEPATDTWTQLTDCPSHHTAGAVCWSDHQRIWVASGFQGYTNDIWQYDIATDQWSQTQQQNPERVISPVAASCSGRYFFGTGFRRYSRSDWWEWYEDGHWERRAAVPGNGRHNAACAATTQAVWVAGGWHYGDSLTTGFYYDDILRYAPDKDHWTLCGTIPCGKTENGAAAAIGNTVFFGLGEDPQGNIHQHWYSIED